MMDNSLLTIEVLGLKELGETLEQMPREIAEKYLRASVSKGARTVRDIAKTYATMHGLVSGKPHMTKYGMVDPGNLLRSLKTSRVRENIYGLERVRVRYARKGWYGILYEYGFKEPTGRRVHKPHLRPALDQNAEHIANIIKDSLGKKIDGWIAGKKYTGRYDGGIKR